MLSQYRKSALYKTALIIFCGWGLTAMMGYANAVSHGIQLGNSHPHQSDKCDPCSADTLKPLLVRVDGHIIQRTSDAAVTINGQPAVLEESGPEARIYAQNRYRAIFFKQGNRVELTEDGAFVGWGQ